MTSMIDDIIKQANEAKKKGDIKLFSELHKKANMLRGNCVEVTKNNSKIKMFFGKIKQNMYYSKKKVYIFFEKISNRMRHRTYHAGWVAGVRDGYKSTIHYNAGAYEAMKIVENIISNFDNGKTSKFEMMKAFLQVFEHYENTTGVK